MRFLASPTTFAVLAFSTLISALPSGTSGQDINVAVEHLPRGGGGSQGIPDCINNANIQLGPLIKDLTANVGANVDVDVGVKVALAIKTMDEVEVILKDLNRDITVILGDDLSNALCFNGVTVGVGVVVDLLATLCKTILLVFPVVLKACAPVDVGDLTRVMVNVSVDLAGIIGLVTKVASSIISKLILSLGAVIPICIDLNLTALMKILGFGV